jgi:hypothetical protein
MTESFPNYQQTKEEIIGLEGDTMTEKGGTLRSIKNGSRFRKENKIKGGSMTKWIADIKEKGHFVNLELRY